MRISGVLVSIIIPVFNNQKGLRRTLEAISNQEFNKDRYEVIVVDNGSEDSPRSVAEEFDVIYLEENNYLNSPYSARNRGLEIAKGEIICLLDTTCAPTRNWMAAAVDFFENNSDISLIGGGVRFDIKESDSIAKYYDSLFNIRMKEAILERNAAKTTNLFIKKEVFEGIGVFPEGLRSGGDLRWTLKATKSGFKLGYCEDAMALMIPRGFRALVKKQFRVAKGQPRVWKEEGTFFPNFIKKFMLFWIPPNPLAIQREINSSQNYFMHKSLVKLVLLGSLLRAVNAAGIFVGLMNK